MKERLLAQAHKKTERSFLKHVFGVKKLFKQNSYNQPAHTFKQVKSEPERFEHDSHRKHGYLILRGISNIKITEIQTFSIPLFCNINSRHNKIVEFTMESVF